MKCREVQPLISVYIDGACSAEEVAVVERHLEGCPACRQLLAELRRTVEVVSSLPQHVASAALVPALSARLRGQAVAPWHARLLERLSWPRLRWQLAAVGIALVLAAGAFVAYHARHAAVPSARAVATVHVSEAPEAAGDDFLDAMLDTHRAYVAAAQPADNPAFTYAGYDANM
jgi:predicted anti-sigma-YlaC factor YlaD